MPSDTWWYFRMTHTDYWRFSFFFPLFFFITYVVEIQCGSICGSIMYVEVYEYLLPSFSIKKWRKKEWNWSRNCFHTTCLKKCLNDWYLNYTIHIIENENKEENRCSSYPFLLYSILFEDTAYYSEKCRGFDSCTHRLRAKCYGLKRSGSGWRYDTEYFGW